MSSGANRFSRIGLYSSPSVRAPTREDLIAETRETYCGPLEIGEDLMTFEIGDGVIVRRAGP